MQEPHPDPPQRVCLIAPKIQEFIPLVFPLTRKGGLGRDQFWTFAMVILNEYDLEIRVNVWSIDVRTGFAKKTLFIH
jgi:hypothetical protein